MENSPVITFVSKAAKKLKSLQEIDARPSVP